MNPEKPENMEKLTKEIENKREDLKLINEKIAHLCNIKRDLEWNLEKDGNVLKQYKIERCGASELGHMLYEETDSSQEDVTLILCERCPYIENA